ncbi:MAG: glutathione synthase [Pseudomonadota bacterium]|jgi:glutathione synthase|nr:glutathione synthase [Pseudomonadota bacterium]MED5253506.1 glutathione synthase [Pseudomonadota bacterium]|tara:strand:+ start:2936 stop:3862 length:927 start_codon:yes stop_codon:yes gene_type:complete
MKVAVQMDHVSKLNIKGDTTLALCLEAQEREFKLYQYLPDNLTFVDGKLKVLVEELKLFDDNVDFFELGEPFVDDLNSFDTVLMRQEPPFDMHYITYTHLLDHLDKRVRVINNPVSVRNSPEKLLVTHFIDLMPKTIISKNFSEIKEFSNKQSKVVLKPLYGKGGEGIILLEADEQMFDKKLEDFLSNEYEPIMVQEYLPIVKKGDKRIILINGEPVGCLNRVPAEGEFRSNLGVGGLPELSELSSRDIEICQRIRKTLIDYDLYFVGIDVIGDYLTEINVTCPTGVRQIKELGGPDIAKLFWDNIQV